MKIKGFKINILILGLPLLILFSCVEEYWPELNSNNERLLVVEGKITNFPGPYTIKLSTAHSLDSLPTSINIKYDFRPYRNAIVSIIDDLGNTETLTEVEPGIYKTSEGGIQGIIGRSYKLSITSANGNIYESDFEEILQPIGVESIKFQQAGSSEDELGYQALVTTETAPNNECYLLWELAETYEYHTAYQPTHVFNGMFLNGYYDMQGVLYPGTYTNNPPYNIPAINFPSDVFAYCWRTDVININYIQSMKYQSEPILRDFRLNFIPFGDIRLRIKYSLLVKQHTISESTYDFFNKVEDQNSYNETDLYTKQPFQIRGNISNINNPNEAVLGFFYASAISEKRMFAPPDPLPQHYILYAIQYCQGIPSVHSEQGGIVNDMPGYMETIRQAQWPVYFGEAYIFEEDERIRVPEDYYKWFVAYAKRCIDCREKGGVLEKPDYWQ